MHVRVLVATSSSDETLFLREVLEDIESGRHWRSWASIQALHAASLDGALVILTDEPVDALLLDLGLCGERPIDAFRRVQAVAPHTPTIFIVRPEETEMAVRLVREGAQDFLIAPEVDAIPLAHALGNAMERHRLFSGARAGCREDALTGLPNGTAFLVAADRDRRLAEKFGCRWMLVLAEPRDDGPPMQLSIEAAEQRRDLLLIQTADGLRRLAGPTDLLARLGDLRFGLGLFDSSAESVEAAWSRIHSGASEEHIAIGAAIFDPQHPASLEILIEQAELDLAPKAMAVRT